MRHWGRSRRRSMPRQVVQSFKKVINEAPVSQAAGSRSIIISQGVDSVAAGQTSPTDADVPTGSIIKFIEIQVAMGQITGGAVFAHCSIQQMRSQQTAIPSNVIGGSPRRNQVFHQFLWEFGVNQSWSRIIKFKVPPRFSRVREGDSWIFEITTSGGSVTQAFQIIYKFYR